jgi:hypothetical protein
VLPVESDSQAVTGFAEIFCMASFYASSYVSPGASLGSEFM